MRGGVRTAVACITGLSLLASSTPSAQSATQAAPAFVTTDVVLDRVARYISTFEETFGTVVTEEHLTQESRDARLSSTQRTTRADLLLLRLNGRDAWLPFRDVFEVNGRAVREHDERLRKLFLDGPTTALDNASRIASESSRYNIGSVIRTIDVPTFALMLLRPDYRRRFTFRKHGEETFESVPTWRIDFVEHARPAIVRTLRKDDVMLEGSVWVEPASGRIVKTLVKTEGTPDPGIRIPPPNRVPLMWVLVAFAPNDALGVWVPDRMNEVAVSMDRSSLAVTATYSNFRRFDAQTTETFRR
jgi:hypothetical protein